MTVLCLQHLFKGLTTHDVLSSFQTINIFLSQWAQGKSLKESIIFASANSTSVVTKIGAKDGILHKGVKLHAMPITEKQLPKRGE